jgi:hypothetical protein
MPYPPKKKKKKHRFTESECLGVQKIKYYYFFVLLVPMFWEADKNKLFDFLFFGIK